MISYSQTLEYIYNSLPMFHRIGGPAYKADLNNTLALSELTGHHELNFPSIHIAGTNGKGSVSHLLASVLQESGLKVALFTSPHLKDFRERMKFDGKMIPKPYITKFFNKHYADLEQIKPSFFEMTFALAMSWFSEMKPDIAVIETGMGGRLDSTNIIKPCLCIITNIGNDHKQYLGNTDALIAGEKAGIIKPGIPVIVGETKPTTQRIFEEMAEKNNAPLSFADHIFTVQHFVQRNKPAPSLIMDVWKEQEMYLASLKSPLAGYYQMKNTPIVLQAIETLKAQGHSLTPEIIRSGFERVILNTGLRGRWQILSKRPLVITDTGHNLEGIREITRQLNLIPKNTLHIVFGMVEDKERGEILDILPRNATYYFCKPNVPRGLDALILKRDAHEVQLMGEAFGSVQEAFLAAKQNARPDDLIFVGGSTFVVAEVL